MIEINSNANPVPELGSLIANVLNLKQLGVVVYKVNDGGFG